MAILSRAYNGSFDGASFMLLTPIVAPPIVQNETQYHIPSSDSNYTMSMGKGFRNWDQKVAVDYADLSTLTGKVGNSGTYVGASGVSFSNVRLKGITPPVKASGFATYELTLQFSQDN
jgi:hypothetical protein